MYHTIIKILLTFNLLITFIKSTYQHEYNGDATAYGGKIYGGSCGFKNNYNQFIYGCAINKAQYNNSLTCGTCINIKYNNNNIVAVVTDICPECKYGDIDLFEDGYKQLINSKSYGREKIKWEFINCPSEILNNKKITNGNIQLIIDEINYYWLSIRPENIKCQLSKMYILQNNNWILMDRNDNIMMGLYFIYNKKVEIPFKIKLINKYDEEIITDWYYNIVNIININKQFNCKLNNLSENYLEYGIDC